MLVYFRFRVNPSVLKEKLILQPLRPILLSTDVKHGIWEHAPSCVWPRYGPSSPSASAQYILSPDNEGPLCDWPQTGCLIKISAIHKWRGSWWTHWVAYSRLSTPGHKESVRMDQVTCGWTPLCWCFTGDKMKSTEKLYLVPDSENIACCSGVITVNQKLHNI